MAAIHDYRNQISLSCYPEARFVTHFRRSNKTVSHSVCKSTCLISGGSGHFLGLFLQHTEGRIFLNSTNEFAMAKMTGILNRFVTGYYIMSTKIP